MRPQENWGGMSETVLWTNSNPTSGLSPITVTLPQPVTNFDYIKITYKPRAELAESTIKAMLVTVDDFVGMINDLDVCNIALGSVVRFGANPYLLVRRIIYNDATHIYLDNAAPQGTGGTMNTACLPINIIGIKM